MLVTELFDLRKFVFVITVADEGFDVVEEEEEFLGFHMGIGEFNKRL